MYFCFIGIDFASLYDFGLLNCSGNGMFFINILFCHLSCFYFAVLSFFMFLLCCPVIFHVSTLPPQGSKVETRKMTGQQSRNMKKDRTAK
jgi:hypothetical protein